MLPTDGRSTLTLVARAARRGEEELRLLADLARGGQADEKTLERLRRSGYLHPGQTRLPSRLAIPILALEAALGHGPQPLLGQLVSLLKGASTRRERDSFLAALLEQLEEHRIELQLAADDEESRGRVDKAQMAEVLDDLRLTVAALSLSDADPALATKVAATVARLVEELAGTLALPRPRRRPKQEQLYTPALLAAAARGLAVIMPAPVRLPAVETLAGAMLGRALPPARHTPRSPHLLPPGSNRRSLVQSALSSSSPLEALYGDVPLEEALRRHVCLTGLGRHQLHASLLALSSSRRPGPRPLAWSSELISLADDEQERSRAA